MHYNSLWHLMAMFAVSFTLAACANDSFDYSSGILDQAAPPNTELTPDSMMRIGRNLENRGDYRAALGFYTRVASETADNMPARLGVARMLVKLGGSEEALPIFATLYDQESGLHGVGEGYAEALVRDGQETRARAIIDLEVERGGLTPGIYSLNGLLFDLAGEPDQARAAYNAGLGAFPGSVGLLVNLALSFALTGEMDAAIGLMESIGENAANDQQVRQNLGLIQALSGDVEGAIRIAGADLTPGQIYQNRQFYTMLQFLEGRQRTYAVYFGEIGPDTQDFQ